MSSGDRRQLLAQSWTVIASAYESKLAPLFQPWMDQLLALFAAQALPAGAILAPACGPGGELLLLANALPGQQHIVGLDLASGMVNAAQQRIASAASSSIRERVSAVVGDACNIPAHLQPLAGVFSCFGLQQMPQPERVLHGWLQALAPQGVLAVCYWPPAQGQSDAAWRALTGDPAHIAAHSAEQQPSSAPQPRAWDEDLAAVVERAGAEVLADLSPSHTMRFGSPDELWQVMTHAGPLHSRLLRYGADHMEQLRRAYVAKFPSPDVPLELRPNARILVARRRGAKALL